MPEIRLRTDQSEKAIAILRDVMQTEESRLEYVLDVAKKRLAKFEKKYGASSEVFINEWAAEDLEGKDLEYVEWAGEIRLAAGLRERLTIIKGIKYDA
jgi:hypothetical protein